MIGYKYISKDMTVRTSRGELFISKPEYDFEINISSYARKNQSLRIDVPIGCKILLNERTITIKKKWSEED